MTHALNGRERIPYQVCAPGTCLNYALTLEMLTLKFACLPGISWTMQGKFYFNKIPDRYGLEHAWNIPGKKRYLATHIPVITVQLQQLFL